MSSMKPLSVANTNMKITNSTIIQPSHSISDHETNIIPLSIFDRMTIDLFVPILFAFSPPNPSNQILKTALSNILPQFPRMRGKLRYDDKHIPYILIDKESGVLVVETEIEEDLSNFLPLEPSHELLRLCPDTRGVSSTMTLLIQLNRFKCGGLVISFSANHKVCDGHSMSYFMTSWSRAIKGLVDHDHQLTNIGQVKSTESSLVPRNPPRVEFPHDKIEFNWGKDELGVNGIDSGSITNVIIHYDNEFIRNLKEKVNCSTLPLDQVAKHTTFRCVAAHVWKKVTVARRLGDDQVTHVVVSINGRPRLGLPDELFGNVFLCAKAGSTAKALRQGCTHDAAKLIEEAVSKIDKDYFQSFIDFGAVHEGDEDLAAFAYSEDVIHKPDIEVDSWLSFDFQKMEIGGGGRLCAILPPFIPVEGIIVLIPSINGIKGDDDQGAGGINVHVSLLEHQAQVFRQIAYTID